MTKIYKTELKSLLIPVPVGVSLMLCLMTFRLERNFAEYVIWYRQDNDIILKSIVNGGFTPIILLSNYTVDQTMGGVSVLEETIKQRSAEKINCVISTTSCSLPREPDDIGSISKVCSEYNVPHIIVNDHGLQSRKIMKNIQDAHE
ncbi:O-phosphoseryl-tRNA(Sec) selenium transferase, SepSecS [Popillia japonica]|uniref:O-phosphoseryl-tRNA(Sec) selenium transferase n=1 Tax=Popillia japonica TaxID=7064 RepID=A0AAW1KK12_POPJA